ncbi:MAG: hypothetical protein WA805_21175 [Trebonia sp.]|uniref:hypothetical protein n=1 Tax=Trebonia sp. TaxID=2767075 RepID=UPI003C841265
MPVAKAGSAAPAAALRTVPDALVADCPGAPADGTSAALARPAPEPETELAVSEEAVPPAEAVPAAERAVLLTSLLSTVELLVPEPDWLAPVWVASGAEWAVPGWLAAEPVLGWLVPVLEEAFSVPVLSVAGEAFSELPPEPVALELVPVGLAPAAAGPECPVRASDAALTVEPTTELAVETGESAEEWAGGGGGSVAACACRENTSMTTKIPAATIASCTAR